MYRNGQHSHGVSMECVCIVAVAAQIAPCSLTEFGVQLTWGLRLRPPVYNLISREAAVDTELDGIAIPKGTGTLDTFDTNGSILPKFYGNNSKPHKFRNQSKIVCLLRSGWPSWPEYGFLKSTLQVSPCTLELSTDIRRSATRTCAHHSGIRCISFCTSGPDFGLPWSARSGRTHWTSIQTGSCKISPLEEHLAICDLTLTGAYDVPGSQESSTTSHSPQDRNSTSFEYSRGKLERVKWI